MTLNLKKTLIFILFLLSAQGGEAWARFSLNGLADLEYSHFEENNTFGKIEASQFQQKYAVDLSDGGALLDRGFGNYAFSIRYQHLQSEGSFDDKNSLTADHKFLWSGNINIVPRKLPLTLKVYSNDLSPLTPNSYVSIPQTRSSLAPAIIDGIDNGVYRRSGLFFELDNTYNGRGNGGNGNGGRSNGNGGNGNGNGGNGNGNGNGAGKGNGNAFSWRNLPKITLDYNNTYIDTAYAHENTDQIYLSVNEKKGWLHYKFKRYDNLNGGDGSTEEEFQVGNVTRNGGREWFYANNWTTLSMDSSFKRTDADSTPGTNDTYSANLFSNAFRSWWDANLYASYYQNLNNEGRISESQFNLPLYVSAKPSENNLITWKNSFRQWEKLDMDNPATPNIDERKTRESQKEVIEDISSTHIHLTGQDLTFKPRYTFIKEWAAESSQSRSSKTAHTLSLSLDSSPAKSYGYGLGYTFATVKDDDAGEIADDFTSHNLSVNGRYAITQWLGVTGSQSVTVTYDKDRVPQPEARTYVTNIAVNMYLHRTLTIDLRGNRSYTENVGDSNDESRLLTGNIRYTPLSWLKVTSLNSYSDGKGEGSLGGSSITGSTSTDKRDRANYGSDNSMQVTVNKAFSSRTRVNYSVEDDRLAMREITTFTAEEGFEYTMGSNGYRVRTLLSVSGSANYSESRSNNGINAASEVATLGFNHYPYAFMSWGGSGRYMADLTGHDVTKGASIFIAFPFPKMNLNASYSIEKKEAAVDTNSYDAQKVLVRLSKTF